MRYFCRCLFCWFFAGLSFLQAQECNFPLPPSNICADAPLLCDLDGYCSNNMAATDSGTPNAFCGIVENNNWVAFLAGSETFTLELTVSNCNFGTGLQAQIFSTANCDFYTAVSNCIDPAVTSATLTATDLVIGERYYLMIDGKGGDVCDYSLRLLDGETLSPANAIIEPAGALCEGEQLTLNSVGVSANPNLVYEWSTSTGNILGEVNTTSVTIDAPGQYQLNISDAGGCADSAFIDISLEPLPTFTISDPDTLNCLTGLQVTLEALSTDPANIYSYDWSTTNGVIASGANSANPVVTQAGTYFVRATNLATGCFAEQNVLVTADAATPVANIVGGAELNCVIDTIVLSSLGSSSGSPFTYRWETTDGDLLGATNLSEATLATSGTYSLVVRNEQNGCEAIATQTVILNDAEPESAQLSVRQPCFEEASGGILVQEVVGGTAPYDITLSLAGEPAPFEGLLAGEYLLSIADAIGCQWDTTIQLMEQAAFFLDPGPDIITGLGCEVTVSVLTNRAPADIEQIRWEPAIDCDQCLDFVFLPMNSTFFQLDVVDINGCKADAQLMITVEKDNDVFIPNAFSPNGDGRNDRFFIQSGKAVDEILYYQIYDRWGGLVAEQGLHAPDDPAFGWDGRISGEPAPGGIYLYQTAVRLIDGTVRNRWGDVLLIR